jgi:hypothetical protein
MAPGLPTGCVRRGLAYQLHKLRHEVGKKKREDGGQDEANANATTSMP